MAHCCPRHADNRPRARRSAAPYCVETTTHSLPWQTTSSPAGRTSAAATLRNTRRPSLAHRSLASRRRRGLPFLRRRVAALTFVPLALDRAFRGGKDVFLEGARLRAQKIGTEIPLIAGVRPLAVGFAASRAHHPRKLPPPGAARPRFRHPRAPPVRPARTLFSRRRLALCRRTPPARPPARGCPPAPRRAPPASASDARSSARRARARPHATAQHPSPHPNPDPRVRGGRRPPPLGALSGALSGRARHALALLRNLRAGMSAGWTDTRGMGAA